jgi:DNA-binding Xre family transcriptional regulator
MIDFQKNLQDKLLSRKEAAQFLGVKENTLAIWACNKRYNLPVIKVGRLCKYRLSDLISFLDERTNSNDSN